MCLNTFVISNVFIFVFVFLSVRLCTMSESVSDIVTYLYWVKGQVLLFFYGTWQFVSMFYFSELSVIERAPGGKQSSNEKMK